MEKLNVPNKLILGNFMLIQIYQILKNQLKEWQFSYNYQRLHGFLKGKTPAQYSEN